MTSQNFFTVFVFFAVLCVGDARADFTVNDGAPASTSIDNDKFNHILPPAQIYNTNPPIAQPPQIYDTHVPEVPHVTEQPYVPELPQAPIAQPAIIAQPAQRFYQSTHRPTGATTAARHRGATGAYFYPTANDSTARANFPPLVKTYP